MSDNSPNELDSYISNMNLALADVNTLCIKSLLLVFNRIIKNIDYLTGLTDYADIVVVHKKNRTYIAINFGSVVRCHYHDFNIGDIMPNIVRVNHYQWSILYNHMISQHNGSPYRLMRGERNQLSIMNPDQVRNIIKFNDFQADIIKGLDRYIISQSNNIKMSIMAMIESDSYDSYVKAIRSITMINSSISIFLRGIVFRIVEHNRENSIKCGLIDINELITCIIHIPYYCNPLNYYTDIIGSIDRINQSFYDIVHKTKILINKIRTHNDIN